MFVYQFFAGAILARHYRMLLTVVSSLRPSLHWSLLGLGFALIQYDAFFPSEAQEAIIRVLGQLPTTLGVVILLVMACANTRLRKILQYPSLQFIGKISYSFYLVHAIVLLSLAHQFHGLLSYWAISLATVVLSVVIAWVLFLAVEKPTMALSRRLAK
ncbi:hypothetical protein IMCC3135_22415 [Granulosicoccus antarcticus IMCC3135]|uniref:Acyltransferase 3 domain-containing protein n=2 Tax=Granulosicoccus TaxID=437504 RepID=A0A2Z2NTG0_9GAMM|nr:hypothetical protein IMCC3135_22415 [Granulosicoccus antarcticus IMCC3135]